MEQTTLPASLLYHKKYLLEIKHRHMHAKFEKALPK
jgi:hypothetical protein